MGVPPRVECPREIGNAVAVRPGQEVREIYEFATGARVISGLAHDYGHAPRDRCNALRPAAQISALLASVLVPTCGEVARGVLGAMSKPTRIVVRPVEAVRDQHIPRPARAYGIDELLHPRGLPGVPLCVWLSAAGILIQLAAG